MEWNLRQVDFEEILDDFIQEKPNRMHYHKEYQDSDSATVLRIYWQDFADNLYFGALHLMNIEIRYVENIIFSISVNGERGVSVSKKDRNYLLNVYLKNLLAKLRPFIGKPQDQLSSWYPLQDLQLTYLEIEWRSEQTCRVLSALALVSSSRTVISTEKFIP